MKRRLQIRISPPSTLEWTCQKKKKKHVKGASLGGFESPTLWVFKLPTI
jgi:hypothetical protein